jgi:hypothetical protein
MNISNDERLLNRQEAAAFLSERGYRVAVASLNKWASIGGGPRFPEKNPERRRTPASPRTLWSWIRHPLFLNDRSPR